MNLDTAKSTLNELAKQEGISVEQVKSEIEAAMAIAQETNDCTILERWSQIPSKGDSPTPEELLIYLVEQVKNSKPF